MNFLASGPPTPSALPASGGRVPAVELNVSSRSHGDHAVVIAAGEIDLYTAPRLHSELAGVIASTPQGSRVVVDMSGVEFCDSTGMNVLLSCLRQARERVGELELAAALRGQEDPPGDGARLGVHHRTGLRGASRQVKGGCPPDQHG